MSVSHWKCQESGSYSVLEAGCLHSPNLPLKVWRIPSELLVFVCIAIPKKLVLIVVMECCSNRISGFASESEGKQAKGKTSFLHGLVSGLPPEGDIQN